MTPKSAWPARELLGSIPEAVEELPAFDLCGPLPEPGVTLLEASAGTGKTYTIAGLMARFIAEGVAEVSQILAVSFTRISTGELKDRIRARLVVAEEGLDRWLESGSLPPGSDDVLTLLTQAEADLVRARHANVSRALADFDSATITTTHGFCQLVLSGMGVAGQVAEGAELLQDPRDLVSEVVDDAYLQRSLRLGAPVFDRRAAGEVGWGAVANPSTPLEPDADDSVPGRRRRLGTAVRKEVGRRLAEANLLTYDDLLIRLRDTLTDPERGADACARLRQRYRIVLVDEFQDTDPVQWDVVRSAFGEGSTTILVLIGDPKQAIYAFRGADIFAYLAAAEAAGRRFTLDTNWRSDAGLLKGLAALFDPLRLGHPEIPYRPVRPSADHLSPGLEGAPSPMALRLRVVRRKDQRVELTTKGLYQKGAAASWVAADVASDIVGLLSSGAELRQRDREGTLTDRRRVQPGDIAVLTRTNYQASGVQAALKAVDVPAVVAAAESVFKTSSAKDWLSLLEALEQPADRGRAVSVALSPFFGFTGEEVAAADDERWERLHDRLHEWEALLKRGGVSALARAALVSEHMASRLLRFEEGERVLTDLAHVAQLLHAESARSQAGLSGLRSWLARRLEEAGQDDTDQDERARRLDTDAEAVQVLTVHRAKGLEFPVVYCPFLWDAGQVKKTGPPIVFHDEAGERRLDVGGNLRENRDYDRHFAAYKAERRGEDLRHLYVALTRAKNQAVVWWASVEDSHHSALGRLMLSRSSDGIVSTDGPLKPPSDDDITAKLSAVAAVAPEFVAVERADGGGGQAWAGMEPTSSAVLEVAQLERPLDRAWRRTSYSGITAGAHEHQIGSEPEHAGTVDEPPTASPAVVAEPRPTETGTEEAELRAVPSAWADLPGGADVGTFVHEVLEETDFAAPDIDGELARVLQLQRRRGRADRLGPPLAGALLTALETPLGPLAGDMRLRDIGRTDRLDEVTFELPLAGGDQPVGHVLTHDLAGLVAAHAAGDGVPAGYAERLRDPLLASQLRGYLTGSIDLVFRQATSDGHHRYFIVDYKTNWLGPDGEPLSAWHYRPSALDSEMQQAHYPLQGLLYSVALHRYLRWRLPDYDAHRHLGGMLYLFLRGMTGGDVPRVDGQPCGVFSWATPPDLVVALSDLLASGSPVAAGV